ncbi:MAG: hypothetical protein ACI9CP_000546 [Cryomorphaceae bacterium]|jgi:hypothetical protein
MKKQCLECQDEFVGRVDAKFCSDSCRSSFHNRTNIEGREEIKRVNVILRKNRKILAGFNKTGTARVRRSLLLTEGFNFNYLTNVYITSKGKTYKYSYDYGYLESEDDYLTIVIKKDYVR